MPKRTYSQFCAIAHALDVVGERWTLLMVRELLMGPKRYSDLLRALPGMGTNLLAERLKEMESWGIIQRRSVPPPVPTSLYELTDLGHELESVVGALHKWGNKMRPPVGARDAFEPAWSVLGMRYSAEAAALRGRTETYEFRVGHEVFHARVADGNVETGLGPAQDPDVVVTSDSYTFFSIVSGRLNFNDAASYGAIEVEGDEASVARSLQLLGLAVSS